MRSDLDRSEMILVVHYARIAHAKAVSTLPYGEVDDLDHLGRTLDLAIADSVIAWQEARRER